MATETQRQGYRWCYSGEHCGWLHLTGLAHQVPAHEPSIEFARRMLGLDRPTPLA